MQHFLFTALFLLFSCGESKVKTAINNEPVIAIENPKFDDFGTIASQDGTKAVFTSRRDAGAYRTYLFEETRTPNIFPLQEKLPLEAEEQEFLSAINSEGTWVLTWRFAPSKSYLLLNSFDALKQAKFDLANNAKVRSLTFAPAGFSIFASSANSDESEVVSLYSYTTSAVPSLAIESSFVGETHPHFVAVGVDLYLYTRVSKSDGGQLIKLRKRITASNWEVQASTVSLTIADSKFPVVATSQGLFYGKSLSLPRQRQRLGTVVASSDGIALKVGIFSELNQLPDFGNAAVNLNLADFRNYEPLSIIDISASASADYLLLTGNQSYFCKSSRVGIHAMTLLRVSDGVAIPLFVTKESGTSIWNNIVSSPCDYFDQEPILKALEFDSTISKAKLLSVVGNKFQILIETRMTGDIESRRLSFEIDDWAKKILTKVNIVDVSQNPKMP